jgi:YD repeat-containing protein
MAVCLGISLLSVSDIQAGKVTYVYDALNRLTRAIYDKTTFTYTYDKTGNRLTKTVTPTKPYGTIDFDGDGKTDILWRNKATGENLVWFMDGVTYLGWAALPQQTDVNWKIVGAGDFNSDGKTDILWRNSATCDNAVWLMDRTTWRSTVYLPGVADLNWEIVGP